MRSSSKNGRSLPTVTETGFTVGLVSIAIHREVVPLWLEAAGDQPAASATALAAAAESLRRFVHTPDGDDTGMIKRLIELLLLKKLWERLRGPKHA
jgi:hypothetical protein